MTSQPEERIHFQTGLAWFAFGAVGEAILRLNHRSELERSASTLVGPSSMRDQSHSIRPDSHIYSHGDSTRSDAMDPVDDDRAQGGGRAGEDD